MKFTQTLSFRTWGTAAALVLASMGAQAQITLTNPGSTSLGSTNYINDFNGGSTFTASWTGAKQVSDGTSTFWAYCIDPRTGTAWGSSGVYTSASLSNFLNAGSPTGYQQEMSSAGYTGLTGYGIQNTTLVQNSLQSLFSHAYNDSLSSAAKSAAFGYTIWEVIGQSTYTRAAGLRSSGTDATYSTTGSRDALEVQIDAYLAALTNNAWTNVNGANLDATTSYVYTVYYDPTPHAAQNFIKVTPGSTGVPEPVSLALVGVALLGVKASRRRVARA